MRDVELADHMVSNSADFLVGADDRVFTAAIAEHLDPCVRYERERVGEDTPGALGREPGLQGPSEQLYDRRETMWAARLWWMFHVFGFDNVAVLNGGWTTWQKEGRPVCDKRCGYPPTTFTARPRTGLVVAKDEVLAAIDEPGTCLINALGRRQHRGEVDEYGRPGHIPASLNVTAWEILDRESQRYRSTDELRRKFGPALKAERIITYCGSGVACTSDAFALRQLGHKNVAIYDGGLLEWCADADLPLTTGED